ncbi:putative ABC transporter permease [Bifidobacterium samirii]|uniref:Putative ABC-transporter type IV n=1 Tax=Bifidobacterium samirii TaxID=2306974 RepID=A0A430FW91_9BIFI|nr:putative ABC transporter permease [Bifidobacterium samirii]RSX58448.1 putative ABC-transporter type IV [Bifidobacterium samirii]
MTESSNDIPETTAADAVDPADVTAPVAAADARRTADGRLVGDVNGDGVVDIDDQRLPLIARIYGIILLIQGVCTIPLIVLAILYTVREAIEGRLDVGAVNLTAILSGLSAATSSVAFIALTIFGVLLIRNHRKHAARWIYLLITLTIAEGMFTVALDGLGWNLLGPLIQAVILVALSVTVDPDLRAERRRETAARRREDRAAYEKALDLGMPGRDLTGKGYISLDFFNIFWLFMVGCVAGLIIETIYHFVLFGEYQDRAGLLWGPFSPIYGCGAVILTALLNRLWRQNWLLIFCASAVIGGTFEYFVSWFMEVAFGITAWDYTGKWLSIDGRTSGKYMFFWGLLGLAWIKLILPRLLTLIQRIPWRVRYALTLACLAFMVIDAAMTLMALDAWYSRLAGIEADSPVAHFFGAHFGDTFMADRFQTMHLDPAKAGRM